MLYLVKRITKDGNISLPEGIIEMIIDYLFPNFKSVVHITIRI